MHRHWLLVVIISLFIGLGSRAEADVLCRDPNGAVVVRDTCRKAETRLNATALGLVGAPGPKGEKGERGLRGPQGPAGEPRTPTLREPAPVSTDDTQTRPQWWQVWILLVMAGVVGFYTVETVRLRQEAQRQTEVQLRPCVIFELTEGKDFFVRNIGNNLALNVKVRTFDRFPPAMAAFPQSVPFLRQGESRLLQGRTVTLEGKVVTDEALFELLRPRSEMEKSDADIFQPTITIEFENVNGQRYVVQESLLHGEIETLNFGPVTTPYSSKLRAAGQELWRAGQKLWAAGRQQRLRKKERASGSTALDEQEWVDGR
jgi:hypothetical protein